MDTFCKKCNYVAPDGRRWLFEHDEQGERYMIERCRDQPYARAGNAAKGSRRHTSHVRTAARRHPDLSQGSTIRYRYACRALDCETLYPFRYRAPVTRKWVQDRESLHLGTRSLCACRSLDHFRR